ncbi:MAG: penicillin amidase, partial [Glaciecola sp.]
MPSAAVVPFRRRFLPLLAAATAIALLAPLAQTPTADAQNVPVITGLQVKVVLPPGNSQFFSPAAFAQVGPQQIAAGQGSGSAPDPDSWGANVDDQREMYWNFQFRDGGLRPEPFCDDPQIPREGVVLCIDEYGVPAVYADDLEDLWFGVGFGVAQIRLFLIDAIRRTARGSLAEIAGPGTGGATVQDDVATRVTTYSSDEFDAMLDASSPDAMTSAIGYRDGINAWIDEVSTTRRDQLPAEYGLLGVDPQPLTLTDISAVGVLFTRFVAAEGRNEMVNVNALRELEAAFGEQEGRRRFEDLVWQEDGGAVTTVPVEEGIFPRTTLATSATDRARVFAAMADYAQSIPLELATGDGTGDFEVPDTGLPVLPIVQAGADVNPAAQVAKFFEEFKGRLHGGSFMVAISPEKTSDGSALLISEPQLLMAPQLLLEIEIHGAGMDSRGSTAPGVPVLGIGYNNDLAWALTTGFAKTIDSFIETTRPDSDGDGADEYFHDGQWKQQQCRTETVVWRDAEQGVPIGLAGNSVDVDVCRTVHGP